MAICGLRIISFVFTALAFVPAGAHLFATLNKMKLDGPSWQRNVPMMAGAFSALLY